MEIRIASFADAKLVAELSARLFEQTYGLVNSPEDMRAYLAETFTDANQRSQLSDIDRVTWVANDPTAAPVGYAIVRRGTAGKGVVFLRPAEIERIYVDRRWHGEGVGTALMDLCIGQAGRWGCDGVWLNVWQQNPRAIAFYQRVGFTIVGETNFTLGTDVQTDWVMARPIAFTTPR